MGGFLYHLVHHYIMDIFDEPFEQKAPKYQQDLIQL